MRINNRKSQPVLYSSVLMTAQYFFLFSHFFMLYIYALYKTIIMFYALYKSVIFGLNIFIVLHIMHTM